MYNSAKLPTAALIIALVLIMLTVYFGFYGF